VVVLNRYENALLVALVGVGVSLSGCGGTDKPEPTVVPRITAEEAILQVSHTYLAHGGTRRLLAPPSELAIHQRELQSRLSLAKNDAKETLNVTERYEYRNGQVIDCSAEAVRSLATSYRFTNDTATVKLVAPKTPLKYRCKGGIPAELVTAVEGSAIELVLRDETLVVIAPATDRRRFLPAD
jgi:hypothetical protein